MATLTNNPVIDQFRILMSAAVNLKEKFDKSVPNEVLEAYLILFNKELEVLSKISPSEVIKKGDLLRHSAWLSKYIYDGKPNNCYKDLCDIIYIDIYTVQEYYLKYLSDTSDAEEKFYDWQNIHSVIHRIAKPRFESFHFADAVEASLKEINDLVKKKYKSLTGKEDDGVSLMRNAFTSTANNNYMPVIELADNSNDSGKNIQQGYMDIFAGAMKGIRNPKAHTNMQVDADEAWEMIVLASHLLRMYEKYN